MFEAKEPIRIWYDSNFGANPSTAAAIAFLATHPTTQLVGLSVSGKNQESRKTEAQEICNQYKLDIPIYTSEDLDKSKIDEAQPESTIVTGPLTNIAKLVLDETDLGQLHIRCGAFRTVYYRSIPITAEETANADLDATRIVLSQYEDITISAFDAASQLILDPFTQQKIEQNNEFLKTRFAGFQDHLTQQHGEGFNHLIMLDALPVCDVINATTITREIIEFKIQSNGTFYCPYPLTDCPEPIEKYEEIFDIKNKTATPTVKHEVIRTVNAVRILEAFMAYL